MSNVVPKFGWIPPDERTRKQEQANVRAVAEMPKFAIRGRSEYGEGKALLYEMYKHPEVVKALGFEYPGNHQFSGCCVGAGGGNASFNVATADAIVRKEPERIHVPFWLLAYGRSRLYMGENSPGEGSLGGTFAQAVREDGILDAVQEGLPKFRNADGLEWGEPTEMSWSDGDARQTLDLLDQSREHLIKTTAEIRTSDDWREALVNFYGVTLASNWGGRMQCVTRGTPPVLLNEHVDQWPHQMSSNAWFDHPTLGEIFYIPNQWGLKVHGICPTGAPPGGFWILKKDADWICRNGEVFAFSQYVGFPAQVVDLDWRGRQ